MAFKNRKAAVVVVLVLLAIVQIAFSGIKSSRNSNTDVLPEKKNVAEADNETSAAAGTNENSEEPTNAQEEQGTAQVSIVYKSTLMSTEVTDEFDTTASKSDYDNKIVTLTLDRLVVYAEPDLSSAAVGVMYPGCEADIVEQGEEWTQITSGDVTGYVRNVDVLFKKEAEVIAQAIGEKSGTILEDVPVYSEADSNSPTISSLATGAVISVYEECGDYQLISCDNGYGYIPSSTVKVTYGLDTAITIEEENQRIAAAAAAAAAAAEAERQAAAAAAAEAAAQQAAAAAAEAARQQAAQKVNDAGTGNYSSITNTTRAAYPATEEEIHLLAAIVYWESGWEPAEGQLAVANVVLNRVLSPRFKQNTIATVIYAPGQFYGVVENGGPSARFQAVLNMSNEQLEQRGCYTAAVTALAGNNNIGDLLFFINVRKANVANYSSYTIINNHCFYTY